MYKRYIKLISLIMVLTLTFSAFFVADVGAASKSELKSEISKLEKDVGAKKNVLRRRYERISMSKKN